MHNKQQSLQIYGKESTSIGTTTYEKNTTGSREPKRVNSTKSGNGARGPALHLFSWFSWYEQHNLSLRTYVCSVKTER